MNIEPELELVIQSLERAAANLGSQDLLVRQDDDSKQKLAAAAAYVRQAIRILGGYPGGE